MSYFTLDVFFYSYKQLFVTKSYTSYFDLPDNNSVPERRAKKMKTKRKLNIPNALYNNMKQFIIENMRESNLHKCIKLLEEGKTNILFVQCRCRLETSSHNKFYMHVLTILTNIVLICNHRVQDKFRVYANYTFSL